MGPLLAVTALATGAVGGYSLLKELGKLVNSLKESNFHFKNTALSEVTKLTKVEPYTIVTRDLLNNPQIEPILKTLLANFAGHYLQAVDIITKVNDVNVIKTLDRLNPGRDETGFLLSSSAESCSLISTETYAYRLPTLSRPSMENNGSNKTPEQIRIEQLEKQNKTIRDEMKDMKSNFSDSNVEYGSTQDVNVDDISDLSVGKLINVKIAYNKKLESGVLEARFVTIPVSVRLLVSSIPNESVIRALTYNSNDSSFMERIHDVRSGRIEFIKDLIFCQDLIDEYKKASMKDTSGILHEITKRSNDTKKYGMLTNNPSLVSASSLFVMSAAVAREVEIKLGGKLDNTRIREKAFENTCSMILVVVNEEWETVTFYTKGIAKGSTLTYGEIGRKSKGSGPDISDVLKALTAGHPPSF